MLIPMAVSATLTEMRSVAQDAVRGEMFEFLKWHIGVVLMGVGLTAGLVWFVIQRAIGEMGATLGERLKAVEDDVEEIKERVDIIEERVNEIRGAA